MAAYCNESIDDNRYIDDWRKTRMPKVKTLTSYENLLTDLNRIIVDAEAVLKSAADEGGAEAKAFRQKVEANLVLAKERLYELEETLSEKTKAAAQTANGYVHEHPWQTVGLVAGAGILLGLLLNRR
jgi:ElaB/YqjD/DUF883 family membrane-anchored ribosome-binding protein